MGQALLRLSPAQERVMVLGPTEGGPALLTEEKPVHTMTTAGHYTLTTVFYVLFIAYIAGMVAAYLSADPSVSTSIQPTDGMDPLSLTLTPVCENATCGTISITANYSEIGSMERQTQCGGALRSYPNVISGQSVTILLCYYKDPVYSPTAVGGLTDINGVVVSFSDIQSELGWGSITVSHTSRKGKKYSKFLTVAPAMVKSFNMGLSKTVADGVTTEFAPFSKNYQMEGLREDSISDVVLQLAPFTNVEEIRTSRSFISLLSRFGSAFELIKLIFLLLVPLWGLLFARQNNPHKR